jgi:uncharacterized membrane protein YadS
LYLQYLIETLVFVCASLFVPTVNQQSQFTSFDAGVFTGLNVDIVDLRGNVALTASSISPNAFQSSTVTKILLPAVELCPSVEGVGLVRAEWGNYVSNQFTATQCPPPQ